MIKKLVCKFGFRSDLKVTKFHMISKVL